MVSLIPPSTMGVASFEQADTFTSVELFNHSQPEPITEDFPVGQSTDLPARAVVGLDANGNLAFAKTSAPAIVPIGVTLTPVKTAAGQTTRAPIYRAGNFNLDALVYHADYDTDAKKAAAFRGSSTPTQIVVRKRL